MLDQAAIAAPLYQQLQLPPPLTEKLEGLAAMGIVIAVIIGGVAGWIAEKVMKSNHGVLTNIVLGMFGAFVAGLIFSFVGVSFDGIGGQLVAGVAGACLLIFLGRGIRGRQE